MVTKIALIANLQIKPEANTNKKQYMEEMII